MFPFVGIFSYVSSVPAFWGSALQALLSKWERNEDPVTINPLCENAVIEEQLLFCMCCQAVEVLDFSKSSLI